METECDFMEIDNNIAARLQIPSLQQQKDNELPESLPVPMLANFGHFESSDEKESSFMTTNDDEKANGERRVSDELESETIQRNTQSTEEQGVENLETGIAEFGLGKQERSGENSTQNMTVQFGEFGVDTDEPLSKLGEGHYNIKYDGSNPLFCEGEHVTGGNEKGSNGNLKRANESFSSGLEPRTENESSEPESKYDQQGFQGNSESSFITTGTDPLFGVVNELSAGALHASKETGNENDNFFGGRGLFDSPDREFVFVNRDGTAQSSPRITRHPLENSDEYFY